MVGNVYRDKLGYGWYLVLEADVDNVKVQWLDKVNNAVKNNFHPEATIGDTLLFKASELFITLI